MITAQGPIVNALGIACCAVPTAPGLSVWGLLIFGNGSDPDRRVSGDVGNEAGL